jgi:uncharacterized protein YbbC (DUF1343 family)/CubicO group peptidase (beta-lactamase class C family)
MVQRLLAARNLRESRLALLSSGAVIFLQFTLFLIIGVGLFVFYSGASAHFKTNDYIFPTYIVQQMPHGIAGLLIAAILAAAMSNLSAALNSLASTTVIDFYVPFKNRTGPKQKPGAPFIASSAMSGISKSSANTTLVSRAATIFWAIILFLIAVYSVQHGGKGHVVETGLSIASVAYGCLLGVFLLGTLTKYATQTGAIIGMITGFLTNLFLYQATFPQPLIPLSLHIAFTWYVLIGAVVTFAIGSLFSVILPKPRRAIAVALILLAVTLGGPSFAQSAKGGLASEARPSSSEPLQNPVILSEARSAQSKNPEEARVAPTARPFPPQNQPVAPYDFNPVSTLINEAIAAKKLPGAVVLIGHNGHVVFHHAYGVRKLAGEPGLNGQPSPAEPMTEDTIFDMASLTKVIVTTTAILQLYEQGKLDLDTPVAHYLPEFSQGVPHDHVTEGSVIVGGITPQATTWKSQITVRQLLTHYSGLPEDVSLKDDWGLKSPDKAEGIRRAMASVPYGPPGQTFKYSDINFITLGYLVEKLSGERLDLYARDNILKPLSMAHTRYLAADQRCGVVGFAPWGTRHGKVVGEGITEPCNPDTWDTKDWQYAAPTAHDDESKANPALNPNYDHLLRGTVHDPTTRRMGGVAGHAGLFSTAADMAIFCQALLDKLTKNTGPFPLKQSTLQLATSPQAPTTAHADATIFTQDQQSIKGVAQRGLGWDLNTAFSRPRGEIFPITTKEHPGSFGHTGFTGTSLWLDPTSNTYVILLANAIHPRGGAPISPLRGAVVTAAAKALGLTPGITPVASLEPGGPSFESHPKGGVSSEARPSSSNPSQDSVILSEAARPYRDAQSKNPEAVHAASTARPFLTQVSYARASRYLEALASGLTTGDEVVAFAARYPEALASGLTGNKQEKGLQPLGYALSSRTQSPTGKADIPDCKDLKPKVQSRAERRAELQAQKRCEAMHATDCVNIEICSSSADVDEAPAPLFSAVLDQPSPQTKTGIDLLEQTNYAPLKPFKNIAVLTNQSGLDAHGNRTIDLLAHNTHLVKIFTPEHGLSAKQDTENLKTEIDPTTNLPVISLFGAKAADKHPTHEQLKDLDAVVIDLQDAGVHFWTYEAAAGYFLEAASAEQADYHHDLRIIFLDRPALDGAVAPQGPVSDPGSESYVNYMPLPVRHGLTFGELARYIVGEKHLQTHLTVIPMQNWTRTEYFADTGLPWTNPSPNLRSPEAAIVYPALGLIEYANISVGRGTEHPFSFFGAGSTDKLPAWFKASDVAAALTARKISGVTFTAATEPIAEDSNYYPFHGQTIEAVRVTVTDREALDTPELGIEILSVLHRLYPTQFHLAPDKALICNAATFAAIESGTDPREIAATWTPALEKFRAATAPYLLYK